MAGSKKPASSEKSLQSSTLKWLRSLPCSHWENRSPGAFTASGVADIVGTYYGRTVAIELKAPSKPVTPTPAQQAYLESVRRAGGFIHCANSLKDIKGFIMRVQETIGV